jgi:two-component system LytT family response regulator
MKILIVDDEANNRNLIENLLRAYPIVEEVKAASSAIEAITILKTFRADILFLDVEMPGGTGFNLLEALPSRDFKVIFVTAHEKYAIEAIRAKAYDYLLKPIETAQLDKIISSLADGRVEPIKSEDTNKRIIVNTAEETFFLKTKNIVQVSGAGNYCIYHMVNGKQIVASYVLKKASETLPENSFIRVHNSSIINVQFIEKISKTDGAAIVMKDGSRIPISRRRKDDFMAFMSQLKRP